MNPLSGFPLLTLIVFLPALGAVISLLVPRERREISRWLVVLISATDLILVLLLYTGWVDDPLGSPQFVDGPRTWIASLGIGYHLAVDGVNLHLILLTALITPLVMAFSWLQEPDIEQRKAHTFWVLLFQTALLGALTAFDLALLSLFWVIAMLAAFFVIGSGKRASQATAHFIVAGALVAITLLATEIGLATHQSGFDLIGLVSTSFGWQAQVWMFWTMAIACGITSALFPLHLWYPATQQHVPVATQVLVGSLLLNLGGYGFIRVCLPLFPLAAASFAPVIVVLSTVGILYAALAALGQESLPNTLAHWNVAQMGLIAIGIFSLQNLGLHGAVTHMIACGLATTILRLLPDGSTDGRNEGNATDSARRWSRITFTVGLLSAMGVPGSLGFVGNMTLLLGIVRWRWQPAELTTLSGVGDWIWYTLIVFGMLLGTWALGRAVLRAALPPTERKQTQQTLLLLPIAVLIVVLGLYPSPGNDIIAPSAHRLLDNVRLGIDRDLLQVAPPGGPDEGEDQPPAALDERERATWLPTWTQLSQVKRVWAPVPLVE
jgi:NADH-quinone oxidoreductase subunit M